VEPSGRWRVYAPHGLSDVFNLTVRPNPVLAPRHVYQAKTKRWQSQWPELSVLPWPEQPEAAEASRVLGRDHPDTRSTRQSLER
jgi:hypothetical protein